MHAVCMVVESFQENIYSSNSKAIFVVFLLFRDDFIRSILWWYFNQYNPSFPACILILKSKLKSCYYLLVYQDLLDYQAFFKTLSSDIHECRHKIVKEKNVILRLEESALTTKSGCFLRTVIFPIWLYMILFFYILT